MHWSVYFPDKILYKNQNKFLTVIIGYNRTTAAVVLLTSKKHGEVSPACRVLLVIVLVYEILMCYLCNRRVNNIYSRQTSVSFDVLNYALVCIFSIQNPIQKSEQVLDGYNRL